MDSVTDMFKLLASAKISPDEWLNWWEKNEPMLSSALPRSFYLKIKPKQSQEKSGAACISQKAVCDYLAKNGIGYEFVDGYSKEWIASIDQEAIRLKKQSKANKMLLDATLKEWFPNFYSAIRNSESLDLKVEKGVAIEELEKVFIKHECTLPAELKCFFQMISTFSDDGIVIAFESIQNFDDTYLIIGDYCLNEDGSRLSIHKENGTIGVLSPSSGEIETVADSFVDFIEMKLPAFLRL